MWFLALVSVLWAFSFGIIGSRLSGLDSNFVAAVRLTMAWLCFAPFLSLKRMSRRDVLVLLGLGALQFGLMYVSYIRAFRYLPSHLVALFSVFTPLYIAIAYDLLSRRWQWSLLACAGLSVFGALVIRYQRPEESFWLGFGLMQISNLAFGLGQLFYREWRLKRPEVKDRQVIGLLYFGGALFAGMVFLSTGDFSKISPTQEQWMALLYLGLVASGLGFFLWNKGATQSSPSSLAAFNNAVVPLGMAASLYLFGEASEVSSQQVVRLLVGGCLIFGAILWGKRLGTAGTSA